MRSKNTDHEQGMHRRSVGDSRGLLLEMERAFREYLLSGSKHNCDTGTCITLDPNDLRIKKIITPTPCKLQMRSTQEICSLTFHIE